MMRHSELEQAAREVVRQHSMECLSDKTVDALREALAKQAEQEPVAWMWKPSKPFPQYTVITDNKEHLEAAKKQGVEITPLYAAPVRTKDLTDDEKLELARSSVGKSRHWLVEAAIAAYKEKNMTRKKSNWEEGYEKAFTPVRTKDLTDDEIEIIWEHSASTAVDFARAVIAADREKNKCQH